MTKFIDGPAACDAAQGLCLRRAPRFLRVVVDSAGKWDALDQLDDKPKLNETIHVYELVANDGWIHLQRVDSRGRRCGGTYQRATYRYHSTPDRKIVAVKTQWQAWCEERLAQEAKP
jgi:hypothetical protein